MFPQKLGYRFGVPRIRVIVFWGLILARKVRNALGRGTGVSVMVGDPR